MTKALKTSEAQVESAISSLSLSEALTVLSRVIARVDRLAESPDHGLIKKHNIIFEQEDRRHGRKTKIESDPEMELFILNAANSMNLKEIQQACRRKFGAKRAPSQTGLSRYAQKKRNIMLNQTEHQEQPND